jgi:large subunit ribosomal protein L21
MSYAIITVGGKQYRVQEGERLLVDRLASDEGATFEPRVLLVGGNGSTDLTPSTTVTARVVGHVLGEKIRIGKYKRRTGYRHHAGFRSRLTQIEIESIGAAGRKPAAAKKARASKAEAAPAPEAATAPEAPAVEAPAPEAPAPEAPAPEAHARTAHPPKGYEDMTVAQIAEAAPGWRRPNLEAALEYEREHASRKGAIAALERALAEKEGEH